MIGICIDQFGTYLTLFKEYELRESPKKIYSECYVLINDKGVESFYAKKRFTIKNYQCSKIGSRTVDFSFMEI